MQAGVMQKELAENLEKAYDYQGAINSYIKAADYY